MDTSKHLAEGLHPFLDICKATLKIDLWILKKKKKKQNCHYKFTGSHKQNFKNILQSGLKDKTLKFSFSTLRWYFNFQHLTKLDNLNETI